MLAVWPRTTYSVPWIYFHKPVGLPVLESAADRVPARRGVLDVISLRGKIRLLLNLGKMVLEERSLSLNQDWLWRCYCIHFRLLLLDWCMSALSRKNFQQPQTLIGFLLGEVKIEGECLWPCQCTNRGFWGKKNKIIIAFLGSNFDIQKNWEKQAVQLKSDIDSSKSIVRALKLSISMIFTRN